MQVGWYCYCFSLFRAADNTFMLSGSASSVSLAEKLSQGARLWSEVRS